jgi:hypothetical protein
MIVLGLLAAGCGSDAEDITAGQPNPTLAPTEDPIPVEPDGGIGDGAEPLPGAEEEPETGDWHGADLATTNCPGTAFVRAEAEMFSFSIPDDFTNSNVQGIDSEVAEWTNGSITLMYDYGWYSGSPEGNPSTTDTAQIDYSGVAGVKVGAEDWLSVFFDNVEGVDLDSPGINRLGLTVRFDDPNDRIIAECIVGSIAWK